MQLYEKIRDRKDIERYYHGAYFIDKVSSFMEDFRKEIDITQPFAASADILSCLNMLYGIDHDWYRNAYDYPSLRKIS